MGLEVDAGFGFQRGQGLGGNQGDFLVRLAGAFSAEVSVPKEAPAGDGFHLLDGRQKVATMAGNVDGEQLAVEMDLFHGSCGGVVAYFWIRRVYRGWLNRSGWDSMANERPKTLDRNQPRCRRTGVYPLPLRRSNSNC